MLRKDRNHGGRRKGAGRKPKFTPQQYHDIGRSVYLDAFDAFVKASARGHRVPDEARGSNAAFRAWLALHAMRPAQGQFMERARLNVVEAMMQRFPEKGVTLSTIEAAMRKFATACPDEFERLSRVKARA